MKTKYFLSAAAALLLLSACSSDGEQLSTVVAENNGRIPIILSAGSEDMDMNMETRASQDLQNTQFKKGKDIDVQITSKDNMTGYDPLVYFTSNTSGSLQPKKGVFPYYPTNGSAVDIRAIYPSGNLNASSFSVQKITQDRDDAYEASDLMFAKVTNVVASGDPVLLTFEHKLTKIQVNLTGVGGVDLSGATIRLLGVQTETAFNPQTGEVTVLGALGPVSDLVMTTDGSDPAAAIIVPQVKDSGYLLEIVLQNNDVLYYKTVQDMIFESGKKYTFNVKVIESDISVSTEVTDWDTTPEDVEERLKL